MCSWSVYARLSGAPERAPLKPEVRVPEILTAPFPEILADPERL
jgi:hypothetical protein